MTKYVFERKGVILLLKGIKDRLHTTEDQEYLQRVINRVELAFDEEDKSDWNHYWKTRDSSSLF